MKTELWVGITVITLRHNTTGIVSNYTQDNGLG